MRRSLIDLTSSVRLHVVGAIDVHCTVRVNRNHHLADVGVDLPLLIPEQPTVTQFNALKSNTLQITRAIRSSVMAHILGSDQSSVRSWIKELSSAIGRFAVRAVHKLGN